MKVFIQFSITLLFILSANFLYSQNVTVGDSTYVTLKKAFDDINIGAHTGNIIVYIDSNTTETATAELFESGYGAASYVSVLIRPRNSAVTVSGTILGVLVKLSATDSVTIDGRIAGEGRYLSFKNKIDTAIRSEVIWISDRNTSVFPHVITGAHRNTIRNCNISGDVDQSLIIRGIYGIVMSGLTTAIGISTMEGTDNNKNQFLDNYIYKCQYGIIISGSSGNLNDSNLISGNLIGSAAFDSDRLSGPGIFVEYQNYCSIEANEIRFIGRLDSDPVTGISEKIGIAVGAPFWHVGISKTFGTNNTINGNYIHDILDEPGASSAVGIGVATSSPGSSTGNTISNNVIYNIRSLDLCAGIAHAGGYGDKIVFNSINLYGSLGLSSEGAHGIRVFETSDSALVIKNNSIQLDFTYTGTSSILRSYCITLPSASYNWGTGGCNFNDYYFPPANLKIRIGGIGTSSLFTPYSTMPSWRFVFTPMQDLMSFSDDPKYISATYLFPLSGSPLLGGGTPISGITKDILGESRSPFFPSIGAYENDSAALPVELSSFTFSSEKNKVILYWTTLSEINNSGFDIERRSAGGEAQDVWMKIGTVSGNGTSSGGHNYSFTDKNLTSGSYSYRLKQTDFNGNFEYYNLNSEVNIGIPAKFELSQNYPNPFNPSANLEFGIPELGYVSLKVYDASGKEVATLVNELKSAGYYSLNLNASDLSSGVYFYRLSAGSFNLTRKMLLVK